MNCQEFRDNWIGGTDEAILSHIEHCDDCLLWIEATSLRDEEVMYLKEFPQPSPQLEDKIMQAIYATTGQGGLPPHSAAEQLVNEQKRSLPKARRLFFSSTAWVSAAAVLLAIGVISYQGIFRQSDTNLASNQTQASTQVPESSPNTQTQTFANTQPTPSANSSQTTDAETPKALKTPDASAQPGSTNSVTRQPNRSALDTAVAMSPRSAAVAKPEMSSRNAGVLPPTSATGEPAAKKSVEPSQSSDYPATEEEKIAMSSLADAAQGKADPSATSPANAAEQPGEMAATLAAPEGPVFGIAAVQGNEGPKDVTISTFTEIQTAVQASDMPIPVFDRLPDGLTLDSLSLQYESQTSKHVIGVSATYSNGKEQVTLEIKPVAEDKQISIPGVFANRQLFTVNGNQAIGVTYQLPPTSSANEHAVHFINVANNQHLYVILSAHSGTLDRLIEMAKSTSWKK